MPRLLRVTSIICTIHTVTETGPWASAIHRDLAVELQRVTRRKATVHPGVQLESSAFAILLLLSDGEPRTLRELSSELDLEQSTINRQVNAAIEHGYLERFVVDGAVSRQVRPTAQGRAAFAHDADIRVQRLEQVFADLAPGTPEALLRELRAFNQAYDRLAAGTSGMPRVVPDPE